MFTTTTSTRRKSSLNLQNDLQSVCILGRVVAKAIYDNKLLDAYFTRSFYKHILGIPVKVSDMEAEDYSFYQGLVYLLEHDIDEIGVELTFSTDVSFLSPGYWLSETDVISVVFMTCSFVR